MISAGSLAIALGFVLTRVFADTDPARSQPASAPATHPASLPRIVVNDDVVLNFFQKYEPDVYKQMMVLKDKDKAKYETLMKDFYKEVGHLLDLQRRNVPLFEITMEDRRVGFDSLQLARHIRDDKLSPQELDKANKDLQALLDKQFDLRQKIRQAALDDQKARIEDLQKAYESVLEQFAQREKTKDDLIKQRMDDLMQKNPKVEW